MWLLLVYKTTQTSTFIHLSSISTKNVHFYWIIEYRGLYSTYIIGEYPITLWNQDFGGIIWYIQWYKVTINVLKPIICNCWIINLLFSSYFVIKWAYSGIYRGKTPWNRLVLSQFIWNCSDLWFLGYLHLEMMSTQLNPSFGIKLIYKWLLHGCRWHCVC